MSKMDDLVLAFDQRTRELINQVITPPRFGIVRLESPNLEIVLQGTESELILREVDNTLLVYVQEKLKIDQYVLLLPTIRRMRYIVVGVINQLQEVEESGEVLDQVFDISIAAAATTIVVDDKLIGNLTYHFWEIISKDANTLEGITRVWILRDNASKVTAKIEEISHTRVSTVVVTDNGDGTYDIDITNNEGSATVAYSGILIRSGKTGLLEL